MIFLLFGFKRIECKISIELISEYFLVSCVYMFIVYIEILCFVKGILGREVFFVENLIGELEKLVCM